VPPDVIGRALARRRGLGCGAERIQSMVCRIDAATRILPALPGCGVSRNPPLVSGLATYARADEHFEAPARLRAPFEQVRSASRRHRNVRIWRIAAA
jgi:hypothetical protein